MAAPIPDFILPILQVPSTVVKCIHKYKYRYRYMEALCIVQSQFNFSVDYLSHFNWIGTCITYMTDSNTIKKCWYWLDTNTDTRIGAALNSKLELNV